MATGESGKQTVTATVDHEVNKEFGNITDSRDVSKSEVIEQKVTEFVREHSSRFNPRKGLGFALMSMWTAFAISFLMFAYGGNPESWAPILSITTAILGLVGTVYATWDYYVRNGVF